MTKQVTHSDQSVWDELVVKEAESVLSDETGSISTHEFAAFQLGASFSEKNCKHIPKVKKLIDINKEFLKWLADYKCTCDTEAGHFCEPCSIYKIIQKALKDFE